MGQQELYRKHYWCCRVKEAIVKWAKLEPNARYGTACGVVKCFLAPIQDFQKSDRRFSIQNRRPLRILILAVEFSDLGAELQNRVEIHEVIIWSHLCACPGIDCPLPSNGTPRQLGRVSGEIPHRPVPTNKSMMTPNSHQKQLTREYCRILETDNIGNRFAIQFFDHSPNPDTAR